MKMRYDIFKIEDKLVTIRKVIETVESEELVNKVQENYNKMYKPLIKYKFSKYKLDIRGLFSYNIESKLLEKANFSILEDIEDNVKFECKFNLRKV